MLNIRIETNNDAFKDNPECETVRCLKEVINWLQKGRRENRIYDINGNPVGYFKLTDNKKGRI